MVSRYEEPYQPTSSSELNTVVIVGIAVAVVEAQRVSFVYAS